jgi:hypothetical protein
MGMLCSARADEARNLVTPGNNKPRIFIPLSKLSVGKRIGCAQDHHHQQGASIDASDISFR